MFSFPINDAVYTACFMGCGVYKLIIERLCDAVRSGFVFVVELYSLFCLVEVDLISLLGNQVSSSICMCLFCGPICLIAFLSIDLFCVQQSVYLFLCLGFQFLDL